MSVRLIFIGLMVFLGFWYIAILIWLMGRLNKSSEYGISGEKNSQSGSGKIKISDLFFHILVIAIVLLTVIKLMSYVGPAFASLGGMIVAIPVRALINASGRKTNVILTLSGLALLFVYLCFWYILIGVPVKPPVMTVGSMKVTLSKTSVRDFLDNGFDIYIMNDEDTYEYSEMLTSGSYTKYDGNQDINVEKGYRSTGETLRGALYLLAKDDTLIGAIDLYGSFNKDVDIKDAKVVNFYMDEDCKNALKDVGIDIKLEDLDLLDTFYTDDLKKLFKKRLWLVPNESEPTDSLYGIAWRTNSDSIFWNEYYAYIRIDENKNMRAFIISTSVAKDKH
ncbi:hypothetical protein [Lachnoanaerobaculum saburreum]|uniref:Uncharacterized protein n=1 Tax=Lachnoanaerobaculum saburreum DSM 3986 TaxID=887325 RepID=E6LMC4_9FIRM|nr:hypothetical protein [Lachnoanaerobaculum saburreum]EFU77019.1 hypothetical protein HMPREF0381_1109 [Lachnoanaerobaculum saburreum DSM 3986]